MLTKADVSKLKGIFATKQDLKRFATKEDISALYGVFVTKDEFEPFRKEMLEFKADYYLGQDAMVKTLSDLRDEVRSFVRLFDNHEGRIQNLEAGANKRH